MLILNSIGWKFGEWWLKSWRDIVLANTWDDSWAWTPASELESSFRIAWECAGQSSISIAGGWLTWKCLPDFGFIFSTRYAPQFFYAGSPVLPVNLQQRQSLDILQRKMLRLMLGWRWWSGEEWSEMMKWMIIRVKRGSDQYHIKSWENSFHRNQWRYASHVVKTEKMK